MTERILVTGFEVFGPHESNPSADVVRAIARDPSMARDVRVAVLPVTYRGAGTLLLAHARDERARGCVLFGLSRRAPGLVLERFGYNVTRATIADNAGVLRNGGEVIAGGEERVETRAPLEAILAGLLDAGVPATISTDPGRFVCNATYYRALAGLGPRCAAALLVHVPPTTAMGGEVDPAALASWALAAVKLYARHTRGARERLSG